MSGKRKSSVKASKAHKSSNPRVSNKKPTKTPIKAKQGSKPKANSSKSVKSKSKTSKTTTPKSKVAQPKAKKAKQARLESSKAVKLVRKKIPKNRWVDGEREPIVYSCSRCKKQVELFLPARVVCSKCGNMMKTPES